MNNDWQAFHDDMRRLEQYLDGVLLAAADRPLTADEILDLRLATWIPARQVKTVPLPPSFIAAFDPYTLPF